MLVLRIQDSFYLFILAWFLAAAFYFMLFLLQCLIQIEVPVVLNLLIRRLFDLATCKYMYFLFAGNYMYAEDYPVKTMLVFFFSFRSHVGQKCNAIQLLSHHSPARRVRYNLSDNL